VEPGGYSEIPPFLPFKSVRFLSLLITSHLKNVTLSKSEDSPRYLRPGQVSVAKNALSHRAGVFFWESDVVFLR
jgi:hypothetical protein